jgi:hypothetical protein
LCGATCSCCGDRSLREDQVNAKPQTEQEQEQELEREQELELERELEQEQELEREQELELEQELEQEQELELLNFFSRRTRMSWKRWTVWFEGRFKNHEGGGWKRDSFPEPVTLFARDAQEAQALAFRRAPGAVLRPSDTQSGALWAYPTMAGV